MPIPLMRDVRHWRERAEEARAVAELMASPDGKNSMLSIADGYDRLAERAETRVIEDTTGSQSRE